MAAPGLIGQQLQRHLPGSQSQRIVIALWLALIGLETAKSLQTSKDLPCPSRFLGTAVAYTVLLFLAELIPGVAVALAIGLDVALLMNVKLPGLPGVNQSAAQALSTAAPAPGAAAAPPAVGEARATTQPGGGARYRRRGYFQGNPLTP